MEPEAVCSHYSFRHQADDPGLRQTDDLLPPVRTHAGQDQELIMNTPTNYITLNTFWGMDRDWDEIFSFCSGKT